MLEEASRQFGAQLDIRWRAYELRPAPSPQPDPDSEYIRDHWDKRVLPMARERGLQMKVPRRQIRSRHALQAALFARDHGNFQNLDHALFRARFQDDADISDFDVLKRLGRESGMDADALAYALTTNAYLDALNTDLRLASELGIRGVPCALVGADVEGDAAFFATAEPVMGAVPYEWLAGAIERALHR